MGNYEKMITDFHHLLKRFENAGGIIEVEDKKTWFGLGKKTVWNFKYGNQVVGPWDGQTVVDPSGIRIISKWVKGMIGE